MRQLEKTGFEINETRSLGNVYSAQTCIRQLDVAARKLPFFKDEPLRVSIGNHLDELRLRSHRLLPNGKTLTFGSDYVVSARLAPIDAEPRGDTQQDS